MCAEQYQPPTLRVTEREEHIILFQCAALATGQNGYPSWRIPFPYKITKIEMYFPDDAVNNIDVYWLTSSSDAVSVVAISAGTNPFLKLSVLPYFIGHADVVTVKTDITPLVTEPYIKMHVVNGNAYAIDMFAIVTIQRL